MDPQDFNSIPPGPGKSVPPPLPLSFRAVPSAVQSAVPSAVPPPLPRVPAPLSSRAAPIRRRHARRIGIISVALIVLVGIPATVLIWRSLRGPAFVDSGTGSRAQGVTFGPQSDIRETGSSMVSASDGGVGAFNYDNVMTPAPGFQFKFVKTDQRVWMFAWDERGQPLVATLRFAAFDDSDLPSEANTFDFNSRGFVAVVPKGSKDYSVSLIDFPSDPARTKRVNDFLATLSSRTLSSHQAFEAMEMAYAVRPITNPAVQKMLQSIAQGTFPITDVTYPGSSGEPGKYTTMYAIGRQSRPSMTLMARAKYVSNAGPPVPKLPAGATPQQTLAMLADPFTAQSAYQTLRQRGGPVPPGAAQALSKVALAMPDNRALVMLNDIKALDRDAYAETAFGLLTNADPKVREYVLSRCIQTNIEGRMPSAKVRKRLLEMHRNLKSPAERDAFLNEVLRKVIPDMGASEEIAQYLDDPKASASPATLRRYGRACIELNEPRLLERLFDRHPPAPPKDPDPLGLQDQLSGAAELDDPTILKLLVDNHYAKRDDRALIQAIESHSEGGVELLLAAGTPPTQRLGHWNSSPLMTAVHADWAPGVRRILKAGAPVMLPDGPGGKAINPLLYAQSGEVARALLEGGAPANGADDDDIGGQPLCRAAMEGHLDVMQVLLDAGAKLNGTPQVAVPIIAAVGAGQADAVQFLLEAGADPTTPGPRGETARHLAELSNATPRMQDLIENPPPPRKEK